MRDSPPPDLERENERLRRELDQGFARERAMADVLQVINASPSAPDGALASHPRTT